MIQRGWLIEDEPWFRVTDLAREGLAELGVEAAPGRTCMDWSERRFHLAGPLGARLAQVLINRKILLRDSKTRTLRVSPLGEESLRTLFGISVGVGRAQIAEQPQPIDSMLLRAT